MRACKSELRRSCDLVCSDSLRCLSTYSSLNADGTPVQFSLSLTSAGDSTLGFVGEAFRDGMEYSARLLVGLDRVRQLASNLGVVSDVCELERELEEMSNTTAAGDGEDPSGVLWLGAEFSARADASLIVYANARRGCECERWSRLARSAKVFHDATRVLTVTAAWKLKPLGIGFRCAAVGQRLVRLYFSAYGMRPDECRRMFREAGCSREFDQTLEDFFETSLREERVYPTRSAVFSFAFGAEELMPKLELCAHCAWDSDSAAMERYGSWLEAVGMDAQLYRDSVLILKSEREGTQPPGVHAFVGVGMRQGQPYASVYLNPGRAP